MNAFFKTLRELYSRPVNVIDGFLNLERKEFKFLHPLVFCGICTLLVVIFNTLFIDFSFLIQPPETTYENEHTARLAGWMHQAAARAVSQFLPLAVGILLPPLLSITGLFFLREEGLSFYSHLILNVYTAGAVVPLLFLLIPASLFWGGLLADPAVHAVFVSSVIAAGFLRIHKLCFKPDGPMEWLRMVSSYIAGYALFWITNGFLAGIAGYLIFAVKRIAELSG